MVFTGHDAVFFKGLDWVVSHRTDLDIGHWTSIIRFGFQGTDVFVFKGYWILNLWAYKRVSINWVQDSSVTPPKTIVEVGIMLS